MPTYAYTCRDCGRSVEQVQAFTDASLTVCPYCGGRLRKQYGSVGVTFNGSGFYRTDSRAETSKAESKSGESKSGDSKSGDGGSGGTSGDGGSAGKSGDSPGSKSAGDGGGTSSGSKPSTGGTSGSGSSASAKTS